MRQERVFNRPSTYKFISRKTPEEEAKTDHGYGYDVDTCARQCKSEGKGYNLIGLQNGGECWCGKKTDDWKKHGENETHCYKQSRKGLKNKNDKTYDYGPEYGNMTPQEVNASGVRVIPGKAELVVHAHNCAPTCTIWKRQLQP